MGRCLGGLVTGLLFLMALGAAQTLPDPRQFEEKTVVAVRFEPEDQTLRSAELARSIPLKAGEPFRVDDLREAIRKLYATGRYSDVRATGEPAEGGVAVTFRTERQWFIGRIAASGPLKDNPTRGQAADASRLNLGQPVSDEELGQATGRILDLLKRNGFYEARVEPVLERDPAHSLLSIRFAVDPGKRARFNRPVVIGTPLVKEDQVVKATKWKGWFRWRPVTEERLNKGVQHVRRKYEKGDRLMARVSIEGMDYDPATRRLVPRLRVIPGPKVEIHTQGAEVSKKRLKLYVPIFVEQTVDRDLLVEGARNLRDYFQAQGYFDVKVDFWQSQPESDHHDVLYTINLGSRQKLVEIQVEGNRYFDTPAIRERMFLQPAGWLRLRHGRYSERFARRDEDAIKALYRSNGFRDVKVNTRTIPNHKGEAGEMAVAVTIEEGPQYLVSSFQMSGLKQVDPAQIKSELASIEGQPFSETNVALDRDFILSTFHASGFPDAKFDWEMKPGAQPNQVSVAYKVVEGEPRYVRDIVITGRNITRQRLLKPVMQLEPGQPLSLATMSKAQRDLYELGIFDKVDTAIQNPEGDGDRKYVLYQIDEGHRYHIAAGLGAEMARIGGSRTGYDAPAGATGFSPRANFEVSRLNLWGLGHSLNFKSRVSSLQRRALLNYSAPRYRNVEGRNISFTTLFDDSRDVRTFSARRWESSAQLSQKLSKAMTMLYRFSFRRVTVDRNTLKIDPLLVPQLSQPVRVGMLSGNLIDDRRDNPVDAHKGIYSTVDLGLASNWFASRGSFVRFLGRNATYHPFRKHFVLARNAQFGWLGPYRLQGTPVEQAIPLPERFFGGGSTSHRGFPDNQAGPRDLFTGFPLGGNVLVFHNTELRFPLLGDNIDGVLFHDMGNVFTRPGKLSFRIRQKDLADFDYMVHAVGFGVRYRTPVGPVRIDLAYSVNPPRFVGFKGDRQQLLLSLGERVEQRVNRFQFFLFHRAGVLMRLGHYFPGQAKPPAPLARLVDLQSGAGSSACPDMKRKLLLLRCGTGVLACLASACPSWLGAAVLLLPVLCSSALPAQTEVPLDRIAMTVGKDVITETEVLDEIRVTALLNGDPLDVSPKTRRAAAERLVDQRLIRQDMRAVEYPEPEASEAERVLRDLRRQRFPGDAAFREALERYGVSEDQLKRHLQWQLAALRFTDYRFRAGMPAPTGGVNSNGHTNGVRALPRRVDQQMEQWLEQARQRTRIQFREGVFQ